MKLALILIACLIGCTYQDERFIHRHHPRALYIPLFYADGLPAGYDIIDNSNEQANSRNSPVNSFLSNFGNFTNLVTPIYVATVTSTTRVTVTSAVSSAVNVNCIPANQFNGTAPAPCARRRRDVESLIEPDTPQPVETSVMPADAPEPEPVEVLSSKSEVHEPTPSMAARYLTTSVKWTTVNVTSYSFVPFTIYVTKQVAIASGLNCIPSGYVTCPA